MKRVYVLGLIAAAVCVRCGKDDTTRDPTAASPTTTVPQAGQGSESLGIFADDDVAAAAVASLLDEGTAGAAEDNDDGGTGQALTALANSADIERYRACVVDGAKAVVTVKRSASLTRTVDGALRTTELTHKAYDERTRTWSKAGSVACAANLKHAALKFADMSGITLDAVVKRSAASEVSVQNKKRGTTVSRSLKLSADGTRQVVWSAATTAGSTVTLDKTVTSKVTRTATTKNKAGAATTISTTVATKDSAPLAITVERDVATGNALSRTIKSGTLVATNADGTRMETTYANVKYVRDGGCIAASGKITGSVFAKDGTEAKATWTIDFDNGGDIVTGDGKTLDYTPDGCDLDVADQSEDDKGSAAEIQDPVK